MNYDFGFSVKKKPQLPPKVKEQKQYEKYMRNMYKNIYFKDTANQLADSESDEESARPFWNSHSTTFSQNVIASEQKKQRKKKLYIA